MIIRKITSADIDVLKPIFLSTRYMGSDVSTSDFFEKDRMAELYHDAFCATYLKDLSTYHAFGAFDDAGNAIGIISCYQSPDEPTWYGTQVRSNGDRQVARDLLDTMIKFNEAQGRYKFYTLWNVKHAKLLRRFTFSKWADGRYDYFDELVVPAKTKCLYLNYWHILFNRVLLPNDTIVRCTFLKQEYRTTLPVGGNV